MSATASEQERGWVAAFGKHPGWDDHIDDIGLVTPELVAFKRLLYFEGVGANIDAGTWEGLPSGHRMPGFGHVFLACGGGRLIVGRLWASKDRKGRSLYPMVVCVQAENVALAPAVLVALPLLAEVQVRCQAEESAAAVQGAVTSMQGHLSHGWPSTGNQLADWRGEPGLTQWPERIPPVEDRLGLCRLSHRIVRDFNNYQGTASAFRATPTPPPQHLRVPACEASDGRSLLLWTALLRQNLPNAVPLFLFRPFGRDWVDILVGTPQSRQFACLLSDRDAVPWVTEIPYTLGPDSREMSARLNDAWQVGAAQGMPSLWQVPPREKDRKLSGLWQRVQGLVR